MGKPTVTVNGLTMCHKGSKGIATSTLPDICLTKVGKPVVPVNYVNVARDEDLVDGSTTVEADGGNSIAIKGCTFSKSTGDEPGTYKGISSGTQLDEAEFISWSMDVTIEGKPVCRLSDKMIMNKGNSACMAGILIHPVSVNALLNSTMLEPNQAMIFLIDADGNPIPNERMEIYDDTGTMIAENTMGNDSAVLIDLPDVDTKYFVRYPGLEPNYTKDIYKYKDNKLYYPVKIEKGDAIAQLGATKGYNAFFSLDYYERAVNKEAPNACRAGSNKNLKIGTLYYCPLRTVQSSQIVTHKIHFATRAVRCLYDDGSNEPLRNRYVLFWELNDKKDDFYITKDGRYHKYHRGNANLPIGYGITDEDGNLSACTDLTICTDDEDRKNFTFNRFVDSIKGRIAEDYARVPEEIDDDIEKLLESNLFFYSGDGSNTARYEVGQKKKDLPDKKTVKRQRHPNDRQLVPMQRKDDGNRVRFVWKDNLSRFPLKRNLVFMILPADICPEKAFTTRNLLEIDKLYLWKGDKLKYLDAKNPERSIFMPPGSYPEQQEMYFKTLKKEPDKFYSYHGYYYSDSVLKKNNIDYWKIEFKDNSDDLGYYIQKKTYSAGGYERITERASDRVTIKLPVDNFLPEWTARIKQKTELLESAFMEYQAAIMPHLTNMHILDRMSDLITIFAKYPKEWQSETEINPLKKSIKVIDQLKGKIKKRYTANRNNPDRNCKIAFDDLEQSADDLLKFLNNKKLITVFDEYIEKVKENKFGNWPYENTKIDWLTPFLKNLTRAYYALSKLPDVMEKDVYKDHIQYVFDLWASEIDDKQIIDINSKAGKFNLRKIKRPESKIKDIPIVHFVAKCIELQDVASAGGILQNMLKNDDGPSALYLALANIFGSRWCKVFEHGKLRSAQKTINRAATHMMGFLRVFTKSLDDPFAENELFTTVIEQLNMDNPFKNTDEIANDIKDRLNLSSEIKSRIFRGLMVMFSSLGLWSSIKKDDQETLKYWAEITAGAADTTVAAMNMLFKRFEKKLWFIKTSTRLENLVSVVGIALSLNDAHDAAYYGNDIEAGLNYINTAALTGIAFGKSFVAAAQVLDIGIVALSVESAVAVCPYIFIAVTALLLLMPFLTPESEQTLDHLKKQFGKKNGAYGREYIKNDAEFQELFQSIGDGFTLHRCSWRAVIPLYESGFVVFKKKKKGIDTEKTIDLLDSYVDIVDVIQHAYHKKYPLSRIQTEFRGQSEKEEKEKKRAYEIKKRHDKHIAYNRVNDDRYYIDDILKKYAEDLVRAKHGDSKAKENVYKWRTGTIYPNRVPTVIPENIVTQWHGVVINRYPERYDGPGSLSWKNTYQDVDLLD